MMAGRIVIIPFLHGKLALDGTLTEPDIDAILEKWLGRHPEFRGRKFHVIKGLPFALSDDIETYLVRVTADFSEDLAAYDPTQDADLYDEFLMESEGLPPRFHKIWIEQCEAVRNIEGEFGTQQALDYLIGEKTFAAAPVTCSWWNEPGSGCWRKRAHRGRSCPTAVE